MDWSNKAEVLEAVMHNGKTLEFASPDLHHTDVNRLQNDRDKIVIYNNFNISCCNTKWSGITRCSI